ncbi:MAG: hypothetical protein ABS59_23885 [Methylobacterium sp. SCN 67-24]|nr:MAG: hypothetical protein ABS59_23885 [Methylobacterium sp. SCN 67-24]
MTDYLTRFSCLPDVGSTANVARAFDIYTALMAENGREDPPAEPFPLALTPEHGATRLWLRDRGSADPQLLITFVTRCAETFALTGTWGFQWAGIASNPVVNGFSGGAHLLDLATGRTLAWASTSRWLAEGGVR